MDQNYRRVEFEIKCQNLIDRATTYKCGIISMKSPKESRQNMYFCSDNNGNPQTLRQNLCFVEIPKKPKRNLCVH